MLTTQELLIQAKERLNKRRIESAEKSEQMLAESKARTDLKLKDDLAKIEEQRKRCMTLLGK